MVTRLIPLDKNPGLKQIGIGEILRRIYQINYQFSWFSSNLCRALKGCEAAVYAVRTSLECEDSGCPSCWCCQSFQSCGQKCFSSQYKNYLSTFMKLCT